MRRPESRCWNDRGLDETVSIILMVILVIALAAIIGSIVFGLAIFFPKSAYIVVQTEAKNVTPDNWYLLVSHMNGDAAYLNHTLATNEGMPVDFQFTTPTGSTVIPLPDPADGPETWNPGDTLYVYNKSGLLAVTKNETTARKGTGLPTGVWRFDVVDKTDDVLIYTKNTGVGVAEPTTLPTITLNTTVTTTVTTVNTTIPTTNVTTVPTTVTPTTSVPTISLVSPPQRHAGATHSEQIHGTNFITSPFPTVTFTSGSNSMTGTVTVATSTMITVSLNIPSSQALGFYDVTVTNSDGGTITKAGAFEVF